MDKQPNDEFNHELHELLDQANNEELRQIRYHFDQLCSEASTRNIELTDSEYLSLLTVAHKISDINTTTHSTEKRRLEKEFLIDIGISSFSEEIRDMILQYFPLEPLSEEDVALYTEKLMEFRQEQTQYRQAAEHIDEILTAIQDRDDEDIELSDTDKHVLHTIADTYRKILFATEVATIPQLRNELLEMMGRMEQKHRLHPALVEMVQQLLGNEAR